MGNGENSKSLESSVPKFRYKDDQVRYNGGPINWTMCVLCVASLSISGILAYRELCLEERLTHLENLCHTNTKQQFYQQKLEKPSEIFIEALKHEVQLQIAGIHKQLTGFEGSTDIFRLKRDLPECNCPPGIIKILTFYRYL
jgi:hypothetical protein